MYYFAGFFGNLTQFMTKLRVLLLVLCFPYFADFSIATNILTTRKV
jgi:hypothetical protein